MKETLTKLSSRPGMALASFTEVVGPAAESHRCRRAARDGNSGAKLPLFSSFLAQ